ncbi:RING finger protein 34, partial [Mortierella antarctica]
SLIDNTLAGQALVKEQEEAAVAAAEAEAKAKVNPDAKGDKTPSSNSNEDDHLCKICCDAALNCVMLNCNHMSTCMDCGKKIMEADRTCPICREYILPLLHVFRA